MDLVFQTRFSFFGASGWRSETSQSKELLFAPARLRNRLELFEKIALASLKDQTDQDFKLAVLSSKYMPNRFKNRLTELCNDMIGPDRCDIYFSGPRKAGRLLRKFMCEKYPDDPVIAQVVLDDDDGVSCDFVEICKHESRYAFDNNYDDTNAVYLTFPRGVSLGLENQKAQWLSPRNAFFTNLGLTLVAPPSFERHPFLTSHRQIGSRFSSRPICSLRPFYVRTVHEGNDSDAKHNEIAYFVPEADDPVFDHFPFLRNHFPKAQN